MIDGFEQSVLEFIRSAGLIAGGSKVLVAVSGGADSVALLRVLCRLRDEGALECEIGAGHVNHGLRGAISDGDEGFVVDAAKELGVEVFCRRVDVAGYGRENGLSVETAGRVLRMGALLEIAESEGFGCIATAHHMDDNAETLVHRLGRGCGFRGLGGIWPKRVLRSGGFSGRFVRPLLCVSKAEILRYCNTHSIAWRDDHTNAELVFTRNRIRHLVLPAIDDSGELCEKLWELSQSAQRLEKVVGGKADKFFSEFVTEAADRVVVDKGALAGLGAIVRFEVVRRIIGSVGCGERDVTEGHYRQIGRICEEKNGGMSLPGGCEVSVGRETVVFEKKRFTEPLVLEEVGLVAGGAVCFGGWVFEVEKIDGSGFDLAGFVESKDRFVECFDADRMAGELVARRRKEGDRFWPLGQAGEKKVGKFLTAGRVDGEVKREVVIVADGEKILWVAPVRGCEAAKVTGETKRILRVSMRRDDRFFS